MGWILQAATEYDMLTAAWASLFAMILGFLLDLVFGDPEFLYHPVRLIGHLISFSEKVLRKPFPKSEEWQLLSGGLLVLVVLICSTGVPFCILAAAYRLQFWLGFLLETFMCYQIFAVKALKTESAKVYDELAKGDLFNARRAVSMIVGRDTDRLNGEQVTRAAVETVAESTSDGVIAPLFYMILGGAVLGFFYKAINTMDSMIGYRNDRYFYFGRAAAVLDDIANLIPARLAGLLMIAAAPLCGFSGRHAFKIYRRDRFNHKSPNSAHTEAACAGALYVQLAGNAYYFGRLVEKPTIGDPLRLIEAKDILRANKLMVATAALGVGVLSLVKFLILVLVW